MRRHTGSAEHFQAALELLILKTPAAGPNHGFGVALHIEQTPSALLRVEEGSLYPALHRLEKAGFVDAEWTVTPKGRRARVYRLTKPGRQRLKEIEESWARSPRACGGCCDGPDQPLIPQAAVRRRAARGARGARRDARRTRWYRRRCRTEAPGQCAADARTHAPGVDRRVVGCPGTGRTVHRAVVTPQPGIRRGSHRRARPRSERGLRPPRSPLVDMTPDYATLRLGRSPGARPRRTAQMTGEGLRHRDCGRRIAVVKVVDAWLAPDYRYFELRGDDGHTYLVRHDKRTGAWELTMFRRQRGSE